jgi:3-oxoacyl-[acyl-carrier-protein] synthase-1
MTEIYLNELGIVNPLGSSKTEVAEALFAGNVAGIRENDDLLPNETAMVGTVAATLPVISDLPPVMNSRNNRMLLLALNQIRPALDEAISSYGPNRIGVVLGTSTSSIFENEIAVAIKEKQGFFPEGYSFERQGLYQGADFVADTLGLSGPVYAISTACTSSAKTLSSARRLIEADLCDAVIVGGADILCKLTLNGFRALEAISPTRCQPFSRNRNGINIGEGAALFLVSRDPGPVRLGGIGETSDAHHMSAPDPEGMGARRAMTAAIADANLAGSDISYVNLHGTATELNDAMEARALAAVFTGGVACSSTKPLSGHMLGAAGANELAFIWLALQPEYSEGLLPPHVWDGEKDPALPDINLVAGDYSASSKANYNMMSNSFAFGGNNISVILSAAQ